jgi:Fic family protein
MEKTLFTYEITQKLLRNIKDIAVSYGELQQHPLPEMVLANFQKDAIVTSAFTSTSIEGNPLSLKEVRHILKNRPSNQRDSETDVLNYNDTLIWVQDQLRRPSFHFNTEFILKVHERLMKGLLPPMKLRKFRKDPVLIHDPRTKKIAFLPPDHKDVPDLMSQLVDFVKKSQNHLDPIILAGLFHKQFIVIHPFLDGNGRSVRVLTKVLLAMLGLDTFHLFSFENYYHQNVTRYFQNVGAFGDYYDISKKLNFTPWLEYFSEGILDELSRVKKIIQQQERSPENILTEDHERILKYLHKHDFITDSLYSKITARAKATRVLDFNKLLKLGWIEKMGKGRSTYYKLKKK